MSTSQSEHFVKVLTRLTDLHHKMIREGLTEAERLEKASLFSEYQDNEIVFMDVILKRLRKAENRQLPKYVNNHSWHIFFDKDDDRKEMYKRYVVAVSDRGIVTLPSEESVKVVEASFFERALAHVLELAKDESDGFGSYVADEFQPEEVLKARKFLDDAGIEWINPELRKT